MLPEFFPKIFGPNENEELDLSATRAAFEALTTKINEYNKIVGSREITIYEAALGFVKVANETMSRPIRSLT